MYVCVPCVSCRDVGYSVMFILQSSDILTAGFLMISKLLSASCVKLRSASLSPDHKQYNRLLLQILHYQHYHVQLIFVISHLHEKTGQ